MLLDDRVAYVVRCTALCEDRWALLVDAWTLLERREASCLWVSSEVAGLLPGDGRSAPASYWRKLGDGSMEYAA